ncbi:hypothetical protein CVV68_03140 [Arthrobacter livingstonensis]|uniref:Heavy metal transporter n=1 Tax=Arthrobacter livingstonensis TaxID=670078 RepID=A0A2V5LHA4_9MICC|nr:hypothetical protein [Arthrobacter livingstonensis]PYI69403.1 hypothetical protein CVV68_03140 [Arthrobacter livingstonensis]
MSRKRGRALLAWLTVTALAAALLIAGGVWVAGYFRDSLAPPLAIGCTATVGTGTYRLAVDQTENAALISALSVQRGMPARAASIALATSLQESKLRNIDYGDLDSVGLFQQRPSQEWGTAEQIMDPVYSATAFYNVLEKVPGYVDMPLNDAAQIVQRSGFPQAYAQHEGLSRAFASALTGQSPAALNCTLAPATPVGTPKTLEAALDAVLGPLPVTSTAGESSTTVTVPVPATMGWEVAHWSVANAQQFGITKVSYDGRRWDRDANNNGTNAGWQSAGTAAEPRHVVLSMAAPPAP